MKDWSYDSFKDIWVKLGCFLSGYSYTLIRNSSEGSRKFVKKFLSAILIVGFLWSAVGYLFASRYFGTGMLGSIIAGVVMFFLVVQIERQIILTVKMKWYGAVTRVVLGLLMAFIGATVIDQILFKEDVERYKSDNAERLIEERIALRREDINARIADIQSVIDTLTIQREMLLDEALKQPMINTYSSNTVTKLDSAGQQTGVNRTLSRTQIENPKFGLAEDKQNQIIRLEQEKNTQLDELTNLRNNEMEKLAQENVGFLTELEYLFEILLNRPVALVFYSVWFFFLVLIESLVLLTKSGSHSTAYDKLIEQQERIKGKSIETM